MEKRREKNEDKIHGIIEHKNNRKKDLEISSLLNKGEGKFLMFKLLYSPKGVEFMKKYLGFRKKLPLMKVKVQDQVLEDIQRKWLEDHISNHSKISLMRGKRSRVNQEYDSDHEEQIVEYFDDVYKGIVLKHLLNHLSIYDENFDGQYQEDEIGFDEGVIEPQYIHLLPPADRKVFGFDAVLKHPEEESTFIIKFVGENSSELNLSEEVINTYNITDNYFVLNLSINPRTFNNAKQLIKNNFNNAEYMLYNGNEEDFPLLTDQQLKAIFANEYNFDISIHQVKTA